MKYFSLLLALFILICLTPQVQLSSQAQCSTLFWNHSPETTSKYQQIDELDQFSNSRCMIFRQSTNIEEYPKLNNLNPTHCFSINQTSVGTCAQSKFSNLTDEIYCETCFRNDDNGIAELIACDQLDTTECAIMKLDNMIYQNQLLNEQQASGNICIQIQKYFTCQRNYYCDGQFSTLEHCISCQSETDRESCDQCDNNYHTLSNRKGCIKKINDCSIHIEPADLTSYPINLTCEICLDSFVLTENRLFCVQKNAIDRCLVYYDKETKPECKICIEGFSVTKSNRFCVETIENCIIYINNDVAMCEKCKERYELLENQCKQKEEEVQIELPEHCIKVSQYNSQTCTECSNNYFLQLNENTNEVICVSTCFDQFILVEAEKSCQLCSNFIPNCNICLNFDTCQSCENGFELYENRCAKEKKECFPLAYDYDVEDCVDSCKGGSYWNKKTYICEKCYTKFGESCQLCSDSSCLRCKEEFLLQDYECVQQCGIGYSEDTSLKTCIKCTITFGAKCFACNQSQCLKCSYPTFYDSELKKCVSSSSKCSNSQYGLYFEENQQMLGICTYNCPKNTILIESNNICEYCHSNCSPGKCAKPSDKEFCFECENAEEFIFQQTENEKYGRCIKKIFVIQKLSHIENSPNLILTFNQSWNKHFNDLLSTQQPFKLILSLENGVSTYNLNYNIFEGNESTSFNIALSSNMLIEISGNMILTLKNNYKDEDRIYELTNPTVKLSIYNFILCQNSQYFNNALQKCKSISNKLKVLILQQSPESIYKFIFEEEEVQNKQVVQYFYDNPNQYLSIEISDKKSNILYPTKN